MVEQSSRPTAGARTQCVSTRPGPAGRACVCTHRPEAASHTRRTPVGTGPVETCVHKPPAWPSVHSGPRHLGLQLSRSRGQWKSRPALGSAPPAAAQLPPRSEEEEWGQRLQPAPSLHPYSPSPTSNTGTVLVAWRLCRSHTTQILSRPELGAQTCQFWGPGCLQLPTQAASSLT